MPLPDHRVLEHDCDEANGDPSRQPIGAQLPAAIRAGLLDPALWQDGLAKYARATNLALVLADANGRLIGEYINPRPTWSLLHKASGASQPPVEAQQGAYVPRSPAGCPFSLAPFKPCNCVADALARGGFVVARDRTGLVHFAVPLVLGGHPLGALVAGQVFEQYPEQLPLEQAAKQLGLSPAAVWRMARLEHPVKRATLEVYADLLATLGQTFLQTRYHETIEAGRLTEMTRLRDRLADADRRKDEFLAMLSHELRNPLAATANAAQLLALRGTEDPVRQLALKMIERQVAHLTHLVDDLLEISRISTGRIRLNRTHLEVHAAVEEAVAACRPLFDRMRHALTVTLPPEPIWVDADPTRLEQVIVNLLNNAAKYTDQGGRIWLTVEWASGTLASGGRQPPGVTASDGRDPTSEILIRVRDAGIGIAADVLPNIFDLFAQGDRSLERSEGGLGIGLCLVRRLVEMHDGTVEAKSAGLGHGSEFTVRLPIQPPTAQYGASSTPPAAPASSKRVLVVDDNLDIADSTALLLEKLGHEVRTAHNGPAALEVARAFLPDLILMDIGLPGMNGYEVAQHIRLDPQFEHVRLVAVTGYARDSDVKLAEEAGFDSHLAKPIDIRRVQETLAALCR